MFELVSNYFCNTLYIRLRAEKLSLLHIESGKEFTLLPEVAIETIDGKKKIVAFGADAKTIKGMHNIEIVNGFKHPRTLLADFTVAEETLKYCMRGLMSKSLLAPSPIVIFQPLEMDEGGYTQVELRAFQELCESAGARKVYIKVGSELLKEDLVNIAKANFSALDTVIKALIKKGN